MTTIAFKDGYVAADTAVEWQGTIMGYVNKIARTKHGGLAGATGDACFCNAFLKWFKDGEKSAPPQAPREQAETWYRGVIYRPNRSFIAIEQGMAYEFTAEYHALGSGCDIAIGAMWAGRSAWDAIQAAIQHDKHSAGVIDELAFFK